VSRAGRRARAARLAAAGLWPADTENIRRAVVLAERDRWIRAVGLIGWGAEQDRRRGERNARLRAARLARAQTSISRETTAA
jgi:hypothetical protein